MKLWPYLGGVQQNPSIVDTRPNYIHGLAKPVHGVLALALALALAFSIYKVVAFRGPGWQGFQ